ncbi:hypothetical protein T261_1343 [Streptomyces lydicus]|nr:hypothetical protein T261_1343 [Streptomyces lydicus]
MSRTAVGWRTENCRRHWKVIEVNDTATFGMPLAVSPLDFRPAAYAGLVLIVLGTLAGAWSVRRWPHRRGVMLPAAGGALLALAVFDLLPHALGDARETGLPLWMVPAGMAAGCIVVPVCGSLLCRLGGGGQAYGMGTTVALVLHRAVEGMTVVLLPSVPVVAALVVHSAGEGLALTALLEARGRRRLAPWLTLACISPFLGGLATEAVPLPDGAHAVLMAVVAGVLLRGATAAVAVAHERQSAVYSPDGRLTVLALGSALAITSLTVVVLR